MYFYLINAREKTKHFSAPTISFYVLLHKQSNNMYQNDDNLQVIPLNIKIK